VKKQTARIVMLDPKTLETARPFVEVWPVEPNFLKLLTGSMKKHGYDEAYPITVWENAWDVSGRRVVVDGHTRLAGAIKAGIREVPVDLRTYKDEREAVRDTLTQQTRRRNLSADQLAGHILNTVKVLREYGSRPLTTRQLAEATGFSTASIDRARGILGNASPDLVQQVLDGKKGLKEAYAETTGHTPSAKAGDAVADALAGEPAKPRPRGRSVSPKADRPTRLAVAADTAGHIANRHADPGGYLAMVDAIAQSTYDQAREQAEHDVIAAFDLVYAARDAGHDLGGELDTEALLAKLDAESDTA
jgi:ParB-like chromosome segregation protein Spo0J